MNKYRLKFNNKSTFLAGIILGIIGLYYFSYFKNNNTNFNAFALGKEASVELGIIENYKIHCHDLSDIDECLSGYFNYGDNLPVTLWLGNSQLDTINQRKTGDVLSSVTLHELLKKKKQFLVTFSQPNANLQEHLILASHLIQKLPIENLILPVVFDDMREINIRTEIENIFDDQMSKNFLVQYSSVGKKLYSKYLEGRKNTNQSNKKYISLQENSENNLNKNLEKIWPLWSMRSNLRGELFVSLYVLRNYIFRIDPSTTRKMLPGHYIKNFLAIEELMKVLNSKKIKTFVYIVPIRNDYKIPYKLDQYSKFKNDIEYLSKKNNIKFNNFESIIPNVLWGKKNSTTIGNKPEIDFMHFTGNGHDILANNIYQEIIKLID